MTSILCFFHVSKGKVASLTQVKAIYSQPIFICAFLSQPVRNIGIAVCWHSNIHLPSTFEYQY